MNTDIQGKLESQKVKLIYKTHYMQSEIFQDFICYNCDDYGLQVFKIILILTIIITIITK